MGRKQVIQFLGRLNAAYPQASRISVVLDTWSIHQHPDVQEALQALPRLDLVWRPPYAPWLNPIEKHWRWVRQDALYLHRDAGDWNTYNSTCMLSLSSSLQVQPKCLSMSACSETAC